MHRVVYSAGANQSPTASVKTTSPNYGPIPLTVSFDGSASSDPDGNTPLTYLWDFGDGTAPKETATPATSHTYTTLPPSSYTVTLKVRDSLGAVSAPASCQTARSAGRFADGTTTITGTRGSLGSATT